MKYCQIKKTNKVEKIECMRSRRKDIFQHSTRRKQSRKDRMDKFLEIRKEIVNMQQHYQDNRDNALQVKRMIVSHCKRQAKVEKTEQIRSWRYTNMYELMYELQVENVPHTIKNVQQSKFASSATLKSPR